MKLQPVKQRLSLGMYRAVVQSQMMQWLLLGSSPAEELPPHGRNVSAQIWYPYGIATC